MQTSEKSYNVIPQFTSEQFVLSLKWTLFIHPLFKIIAQFYLTFFTSPQEHYGIKFLLPWQKTKASDANMGK